MVVPKLPNAKSPQMPSLATVMRNLKAENASLKITLHASHDLLARTRDQFLSLERAYAVLMNENYTLKRNNCKIITNLHRIQALVTAKCFRIADLIQFFVDIKALSDISNLNINIDDMPTPQSSYVNISCNHTSECGIDLREGNISINRSNRSIPDLQNSAAPKEVVSSTPKKTSNTKVSNEGLQDQNLIAENNKSVKIDKKEASFNCSAAVGSSNKYDGEVLALSPTTTANKQRQNLNADDDKSIKIDNQEVSLNRSDTVNSPNKVSNEDCVANNQQVLENNLESSMENSKQNLNADEDKCFKMNMNGDSTNRSETTSSSSKDNKIDSVVATTTVAPTLVKENKQRISMENVKQNFYAGKDKFIKIDKKGSSIYSATVSSSNKCSRRNSISNNCSRMNSISNKQVMENKQKSFKSATAANKQLNQQNLNAEKDKTIKMNKKIVSSTASSSSKGGKDVDVVASTATAANKQHVKENKPSSRENSNLIEATQETNTKDSCKSMSTVSKDSCSKIDCSSPKKCANASSDSTEMLKEAILPKIDDAGQVGSINECDQAKTAESCPENQTTLSTNANEISEQCAELLKDVPINEHYEIVENMVSNLKSIVSTRQENSSANCNTSFENLESSGFWDLPPPRPINIITRNVSGTKSGSNSFGTETSTEPIQNESLLEKTSNSNSPNTTSVLVKSILIQVPDGKEYNIPNISMESTGKKYNSTVVSSGNRIKAIMIQSKYGIKVKYGGSSTDDDAGVSQAATKDENSAVTSNLDKISGSESLSTHLKLVRGGCKDANCDKLVLREQNVPSMDRKLAENLRTNSSDISLRLNNSREIVADIGKAKETFATNKNETPHYSSKSSTNTSIPYKFGSTMNCLEPPVRQANDQIRGTGDTTKHSKVRRSSVSRIENRDLSKKQKDRRSNTENSATASNSRTPADKESHEINVPVKKRKGLEHDSIARRT